MSSQEILKQLKSRLHYNDILPAHYTPLQYIESTGKQTLPLNIDITPDLEIDIEWALCKNNSASLFGVNEYGIKRNENTFNITCGTTKSLPVKYYLDEFYYACFNILISHNCSIYNQDGTKIINYKLDPLTIINNKITLCDNNLIQKIGHCICKNTNGTIGDFIPVKNNLDNTIGLYDIITTNFISSSTKYPFKAGPVVNTIKRTTLGSKILSKPIVVPTGYKEIDYIQSNGTQRLYLDATLDKYAIIKIDFEILDYENHQTIFGAEKDNKRIGLDIYNDTFIFRTGSLNQISTPINHNINIQHIEFHFHKTSNNILLNEVWLTAPIGDLPKIAFGLLYNNGSYDARNAKIKLHHMAEIDDHKLLFNLIPAVRQQDNCIGVYDTIGHNFFTTEEMNFSAGADVLTQYNTTVLY